VAASLAQQIFLEGCANEDHSDLVSARVGALSRRLRHSFDADAVNIGRHIGGGLAMSVVVYIVLWIGWAVVRKNS
jgi:hypothetical protein